MVGRYTPQHCAWLSSVIDETRKIILSHRYTGPKACWHCMHSGLDAILRQPFGRLQHQALDAAAFDQMLLQHLVDVLLGRAAIPNAFGIDHQVGAQLAAVKTARVVDTHLLQPQVLGAGLHIVAQGLRPLVGATAARMAVGPPVGATEDVRFVIGLGIGGFGTLAHSRLTPSCRCWWRCWRAVTRTPAASAASVPCPASRRATRS